MLWFLSVALNGEDAILLFTAHHMVFKSTPSHCALRYVRDGEEGDGLTRTCNLDTGAYRICWRKEKRGISLSLVYCWRRATETKILHSVFVCHILHNVIQRRDTVVLYHLLNNT